MGEGLNVGKIILLEPDSQYAEEMMAQASSMGICLDHFHNMLELGYLGRFTGYHAIIINHKLEKMTGREIAVHLDKLLGGIPILLLEEDSYHDKQHILQPIQSVYRVMSKREGVRSILESAVSAANLFRSTEITEQISMT